MQSRATRVTVLRTIALMILKLVNPLESLEDRIAIHMNSFLRAPLVFSSSSLKQRSNRREKHKVFKSGDKELYKIIKGDFEKAVKEVTSVR